MTAEPSPAAGVDDPAGSDADASARLRGALEALLVVVDEPAPAEALATFVEAPVHVVVHALSELARDYAGAGRGFELRETRVGWRLYSAPAHAAVVERYVVDGQQARLTQAALETLAVVAYRQPVSRARVSSVRGVNCDGVIRTLTARGLIEQAGVEGPAGATLYRTSQYFLDRMGLDSLDQLPDIAPYLPDLETLDDEEPAR